MYEQAYRSENIAELTYPEMVAGFIRHLRALGRSTATIKQRKHGAWCYLNYLAGRGIGSPLEATWQDIEAYQVHVMNASPSRHHAQTRMLSVRAFDRYLRLDDDCTVPPSTLIPLPKVAYRLPKGVLRPDEVFAIMAIPDIRTPEGFTMRTVMEVTYSSGIRLGEVASLCLSDIGEGRVHIRDGKGMKDRIVPLGKRAQSWLDSYFSGARAQAEAIYGEHASDAVFLHWRLGRRLSKYIIHQSFRTYVRQAGIARRITFHGLRHAFATHLVQGGADVLSVKEMLGHSRVSTTRRYVELTIRDLKEAHKRFHPRQ